jgi:hypothetical protein
VYQNKHTVSHCSLRIGRVVCPSLVEIEFEGIHSKKVLEKPGYATGP